MLLLYSAILDDTYIYMYFSIDKFDYWTQSRQLFYLAELFIFDRFTHFIVRHYLEYILEAFT